jgi:hypothetical protein
LSDGLTAEAPAEVLDAPGQARDGSSEIDPQMGCIKMGGQSWPERQVCGQVITVNGGEKMHRRGGAKMHQVA